YSLEKPHQWESFVRKMNKHERLRQVCISRHFIDEEKARVLEENGVNVYVWTVDDPEDAHHWVEQGADGIISNNLRLLEGLPRRAASRYRLLPDQVHRRRLQRRESGRSRRQR
ncbi:MAG TPA: glycerophosphodiester phosphodiesterase family protein, partial [Dehalococcoidia bacterium]